ncbi:flavohemoprotein [Ktedonobacter sp. SOSP1-85]|nr:flavohemoprotein [Ktedonobacter sp. SOSP1-85]
MSDGQRTTERIALLLHKPDEEVARIVEELTVNGYLSTQTEGKVFVMNIELLKESFKMVAPRKEEFAQSFYNRLFTYYPETKTLFANTDMRRQESSLMATLATVISGVERGDNLVPVLNGLGKRHDSYGAAPEHYPLVGGVLLETFHEYLGNSFTPEMQEAWSQAFELISNQMIQGAHA